MQRVGSAVPVDGASTPIQNPSPLRHVMTLRLVRAALLCLLVIPAPAFADAGGALAGYSVTTWTEKEGLPAGRVRALAQGDDGYLWLGLETGLVRFDGVRFARWDSSRMPEGSVWSLLSARDHSLWIGFSGATPIVRLHNGRMTPFGAAEGLPNTLAATFYEDREGVLWAGTLSGLFRFTGKKWERVDVSDATAVIGVFEDGEGRMLAATPAGVYRRPSSNAPFELVARVSVASNVYSSFTRDHAGAVWVTDFHDGFHRLDQKAALTPPTSMRGWGVQLLNDRRGAMWVATQGQGLWRVTPSADGRAPGVSVATMRDGLASEAVQALLEDREGNLWVGTPGGLQRLSPHRVTPRRDLGVARALESTPDGSMWVGTSSGLMRFTGGDSRLYTEADGLPGSVVLALHAGPRGELWIATELGVAVYESGRFTRLPLPKDAVLPRIFAIATAGEDVWLRDFFFRLHHWRNGALLPVDDLPEPFRTNVRSVHTDRNGHVWFGAGDGQLAERDPSGALQVRQLPIGGAVRLYEDREGVLWVGGDDGMSRIAGGEVLHITRAAGFPGSVKSIAEDKTGVLWVGLGTGVIRLEKPRFLEAARSGDARKLLYRFFNAADGVAGIPIAEGTCTGVRGADGRIWFVTSGGLTIVDPDRVGPPPVMPPVRIESVTADAQKFDPQLGLFAPSRTSHLHIAFTALTLTDPTRIRFRYRLDGFDHDWVDPGGSREAVYTNLPPQQYRFVVEATNGDGVWTPGTTWNFGVEPMFYQTRAFLVVMAALAGLVVAVVWRLRVRGVRREFALVLAERIRMSRAIHDTLLQGLAGLALQMDDLSHTLDAADPASARPRVVKIRRMVEEYIREARQSIWDLRSPRLTQSDLPNALKQVGERAIGERAVTLDFSVKGTPHRCAPGVEEQLLHIGQEAVNNAVQHGRATRVDMEIAYDDGHTRLRVSDDGCGFDPGTLYGANGHYGLISMRERAEQVKGRVRIDSAPGRGTLVEAVVPSV
jgi:signal transduction histidine kinase/ligand-binding sensor domain-containing protein